MRREIFAGLLSVLFAGAILAAVLLPDLPWPSRSRDLLARQGFEDTGVSNLVAAMYLGYRAYDTLGELVVLLAAISAAVALLSGVETGGDIPSFSGGAIYAQRSGARRNHTDILDLTAGKLSPMVLLFGWYLIFYGGRSPGGGFQGGVVLASGVIFIALGRREGGLGRLAPRHTALGLFSLGWVEAVSFFFIVVLCFAGFLAGGTFLEDPRSAGLALPQGAYIVALNIAIGLKVGSGIALLCLLMMGRAHD